MRLADSEGKFDGRKEGGSREGLTSTIEGEKRGERGQYFSAAAA